MGGSGSGSWYRWNKKDTVEDVLVLDVNWMKKHKAILQNKDNEGIITWTSRHSKNRIGYKYCEQDKRLDLNYSTDDKQLDYAVYLSTINTNFNGKRWVFKCPNRNCEKTVTKLYLKQGYFLCRHCQDLTYTSRQERYHFRMLSQAQKINMNLGGDGCEVGDNIPPKPKGMHKRTFTKKVARMQTCYDKAIFAAAQHLGIIDDYL